MLRDSDTVARFGGDEFVMLLTDGGSAAGARIATRIAQVLQAPFLLGDTPVNVEASIGITAATNFKDTSFDELRLLGC